jgi:hypothetical protein
MTKYEEMCAAAKTARNEFDAYRIRCVGYLGGIIGALQSHCGVPSGKITFLKWDGQREEPRNYLAADPPMKYALPGAMEYDEEDEFWHLGVSISLTENNFFPKQWVSFVLCVREQNQVPVVRTGLNGKAQVVRVDNEDARKKYCETLTDRIVETLRDPAKPELKAIGFVLGTESPKD